MLHWMKHDAHKELLFDKLEKHVDISAEYDNFLVFFHIEEYTFLFNAPIKVLDWHNIQVSYLLSL